MWLICGEGEGCLDEMRKCGEEVDRVPIFKHRVEECKRGILRYTIWMGVVRLGELG